MPEADDFSRSLDTQIQYHSVQNYGNRCLCYSGKSENFSTTCVACSYGLHPDVKPGVGFQKPLPLPDWKLTDLAAVSVKKSPEVGISSPAKRLTRARSSISDDRDHARTTVTEAPQALYLQPHGQRGRPPNGSRVGPVGFRGVRQRKGVRGYLVEIRPPKWKKTIWLGTYNSDREAAGAYDAGIFYTNKKTKYNFPSLEPTFPPLPPKLRLDNPDDNEEIKVFVQKEAREASRKIKDLPISATPSPAQPAPTPTRSQTSNNTTDHPASSTITDPCNILGSSATSSCDDSASDQEFNIADDLMFEYFPQVCTSALWSSYELPSYEFDMHMQMQGSL